MTAEAADSTGFGSPGKGAGLRGTGSKRNRWIATFSTGIVAGLLAGLFGVGGGIIMVPALVYLVGLDQIRAHGTSLAAVTVLAVSSGLSYALAGQIDWHLAVLLASGSVFGAWFGAKLLPRMNPRSAAIAFNVLLVVTALRMLIGGGDSGTHRSLTLWLSVALVVAGALVGLLASLLGVGGGAVLVPLMVVGLGMPTAMAKGTSLAVIVFSSVVGTVGNRRHSNVDVSAAVMVGLSGVVFGFIGGQISLGLSDRVADITFALLLLVVATKMAWDLRRDRAPRDGDLQPG